MVLQKEARTQSLFRRRFRVDLEHVCSSYNLQPRFTDCVQKLI